MNILILANADSVWTKRYIENILIGSEFNVSVFSPDNSAYSDFYASNNIKIYCYNNKASVLSTSKRWLLKISNMIKIALMDFAFRYLKHFDVIQVHYVQADTLQLACRWADANTNVVSSYWGSDILRSSESYLVSMKSQLDRVDYITLETDFMINKFNEVFRGKYDSKIVKVLFGVSGLDTIRTLKSEGITRNECKSELGIDSRKISIAIGMNAIKEQQHLRVIEVIEKLPQEILQHIQLIFQMTYGYSTPEYIDEIKRRCGELSCESLFFEDFMQDELIAKLRLATDILIHAQTTDSFSAAIQEHLYAGTLVINPKWICYDVLNENDVEFIEYGSFDELESILKLTLNEWQDRSEELSDYNAPILYGIESWSAVAKIWKKLYIQK